MSVYLDYNASAPIDSRVLDYMVEIYKGTLGNADSRTHDFGESSRQVVEKARNEVANLLSIKKDEVFFTSGATESNNIVLQGLKEYRKLQVQVTPSGRKIGSILATVLVEASDSTKIGASAAA